MVCSVNGCDSPVKYKGLCGKHYKRVWRYGDPNFTNGLNMTGIKPVCAVKGCDSLIKSYVTKLCNVHHTRWTRFKRINAVRAKPGEGSTNKDGYRLLTIDGKRVYEHIYLAEKALGKPLPGKAIVHHVNDDRADNFTPFNLVICPDQKYHFLIHRRAEEFAQLGFCLSTE